MGDSLKAFGKDLSETLIRGAANPVIGLFIGVLATSLIQSSSSTTSIVVGLVAGSLDAVVIAFSHLLFNITGIIIWWPLKFIPITMAEKFSDYATRYKLVPIAYVLLIFFILPLAIIYFTN